MSPEVGQWYRDAEGLGHFFKVLAVRELALDVVDPDGERRTVNRLLFEHTMQHTTRVPVR